MTLKGLELGIEVYEQYLQRCMSLQVWIHFLNTNFDIAVMSKWVFDKLVDFIVIAFHI